LCQSSSFLFLFRQFARSFWLRSSGGSSSYISSGSLNNHFRLIITPVTASMTVTFLSAIMTTSLTIEIMFGWTTVATVADITAATPTATEPEAPRELSEEKKEAAALAQKEKEEEEKQMTLDVFRAAQATKLSKAPATVRKANEGSADKNFEKKAVVMTKDTPEETELFFKGKQVEKKVKPKAAETAEEKKEISKQEFFDPKPYSSPYDRGGKGKGGNSATNNTNNSNNSNNSYNNSNNYSRSQRSRAPAPPPLDDKAYPSLGSQEKPKRDNAITAQ